ncbi:MAG: hypothetical protein KF750_09585 [Xanthobacteraceae bacterium]|nr:hypothetical protein [Xanthobacteraceae bacterium]
MQPIASWLPNAFHSSAITAAPEGFKLAAERIPFQRHHGSTRGILDKNLRLVFDTDKKNRAVGVADRDDAEMRSDVVLRL